MGAGTALIQDLCGEAAARIPLWLEDLRLELLQSPYGHHDDQVGSMSQFLNWIDQHQRNSVGIRENLLYLGERSQAPGKAGDKRASAQAIDDSPQLRPRNRCK